MKFEDLHKGGAVTAMYHYVRDNEKEGTPNLKSLDFKKFQQQLDWLCKNFEPLSFQVYNDCIKNSKAFPNKTFMLTFDDGLKDHYSHVFTELRQRKLWGFFFVNSKVYLEKEPLEVHMTHFILDKIGSENFNKKIIRGLEDFKIKVEVDKNSLNANDALTVKFVLSGAGNFEILKSVSPDFPANWEVFDPTINEQTTISTLGKKGKKTYEYVVIPRKSGNYSIPAFTLHYFNPTIGLYQKITTESVNIQVGGGGDNTSGKALFSGSQSSKVEAVEEEIRFLKTDFIPQKSENDYFPESKIFNYSLLLGSVFWFLLTFLPWIVRFFPDKTEQRKSKIQQIIKEFNLHTKKENLKGNEVIMLWEKYWTTAFNLDKSKQSVADITEILQQNKISDELIERFKNIMNSITRSQYAGGSVNFNNLAKESIELIKLLEEEFLLANDQDDN